MICPYCNKEMVKGIMSGDGRSPLCWKAGEKKADIWDKLASRGSITAANFTLASFTIETYFCPVCKKMIFDTDITD